MANQTQTIMMAAAIGGGLYLLAKGGSGKIDAVKGPLTDGKAMGGTYTAKIPAGAPINYVNVLKAVGQGVEVTQKIVDGIFKVFGTKPDGMPRIPAGTVAATATGGSNVKIDWNWDEVNTHDPAALANESRSLTVENLEYPDGSIVAGETTSIELPAEWADAFAADPTILEDYLFGIEELGIEADVYSEWAGVIGDPFNFEFA